MNRNKGQTESDKPDKAARMQKMFEDYQDQRASEKRWRLVRKIWGYQIYEVPILAWLALLAAAAASLNLQLGRPFF